jgi:hypothetical protein
MDSRIPTLIAASLLLASCGPKANEAAPPAPEPAPATAPVQAPAPAPATPTPAQPAPPAAETPTPADEVTPEAAAEVAREYFALLGAKQYAMALALWGSNAPSKDDLARQRDKYATYEAAVGKPGQQEGAAGSSYIEIPVKVAATLKSGAAEKLAGTVVLRRVNDVPGSTTEQRHWHIYSVDLKPAA